MSEPENSEVIIQAPSYETVVQIDESGTLSIHSAAGSHTGLPIVSKISIAKYKEKNTGSANNKPVNPTSEPTHVWRLLILFIPVAISIGHFIYLNNHPNPGFENINLQGFVTMGFYMFGAIGAGCAVLGGLIAAYLSYSDRWKKQNFLGASLRFTAAVFGFYALYIGVLYSDLIIQ